ncbi:hypothetical protein SynPROS71_00102 [Synechococcus sp. PROS-7-1]|uniref:glycosyltransferase 61 family protein n=1 Tax=Synechococcus sp. PROS-7-1 TaxID=1442556 RepID=UPI0016452D26|nr:glycosyltransferase 61 family protein [Synechococcus sp. PROS-7-1]QNI83939.1 hypothetical protein SynPROS71_00102 [Synechococcus sp. PROS-7-1]
MSNQLFQRSLDVNTLCVDPSVSHVASINLEDWEFIHKCYKSIPHMPLAENSKSYLKNHLFANTKLELLEIHNPRILVYRFPSGEVRSFVTTQSGFLLESSEQSLWDRAFSFIKSSKNAISFNLPSELPSISPNSAFFYANHSLNFTHFLLDFWSLFAKLSSSGLPLESLPSEIPIFEAPVSWQSEYFGLINRFQPRFFHDLFRQFNTTAFWFCPSSIIFPVFENKPLSLFHARHYLHHNCSKGLSQSQATPLNGRIVLLTRNDARRARIKNLADIEDLVVSMGGHVVDPVQYSASERLSLFSRPSIFLAESSGCTNFALFANSQSRLIFLLEPSVLNSREFLVGGWPYTLGFSSAVDYVVGSSFEALRGSPIGAAEFSPLRIEQLIDANLDVISKE